MPLTKVMLPVAPAIFAVMIVPEKPPPFGPVGPVGPCEVPTTGTDGADALRASGTQMADTVKAGTPPRHRLLPLETPN